MAYSEATRGEHLVSFGQELGQISFVQKKTKKLKARTVLEGEFQQAVRPTNAHFSGNIRSVILDGSWTDSKVVSNLFGGSVKGNEF